MANRPTSLENCRLCDEETHLVESHVIPKFVFRWLKKTSATGYFRSGVQPDLRLQDGDKYYWLCESCEGILNKWETEFANKIFYPFSNEQITSSKYGPWLLKFCASISWRVLMEMVQENHLSHLSDEMRKKANLACSNWKDYLQGNRPHPGINEQHILPLEALESFNFPNMPTNINRYFLRALDKDVVVGQSNEAYVISKLGRFIIIGFISVPEVRFWRETKINSNQGIIGGSKKYLVPTPFGHYLIERANKLSKAYNKISNNQKAKLNKFVEDNPDLVANSETFTALEKDVSMFGSAAFRSIYSHDG